MTENKHQKDKLEGFKNNKDVNGLYSHMKNQMGWKAASTPAAPWLGNQIVRKPRDIVNVQINFYKEKIRILMSKLPVTCDTHCYI